MVYLRNAPQFFLYCKDWFLRRREPCAALAHFLLQHPEKIGRGGMDIVIPECKFPLPVAARRRPAVGGKFGAQNVVKLSVEKVKSRTME